MKPVVVIVGRPNVGKSTLFNRLTRSRAAIVADEPGVTRDRQYGDGVIGDRPYHVVDTGGIAQALSERKGGDALRELMTAQVREALAEADAILFLVDVREGLNALDREIAGDLRRLGKPVTLAVNKAEGMDRANAAAEFHALGLGDPWPVSSAHGEGISDLMAHVLAPLPRAPEDEAAPADMPRIAVVGRPNAGKSTLVNALLGEQRVIVSDQPGTTRDSIHLPLERRGRAYVLIDTAGVRRRSRVDEAVEKFSAIKTLQAVDEANVAILVLDAVAGISEQDASLGGYVLERGRGIVIAVNKWDAVPAGDRDWAKRELERKLGFLAFARAHYISALKGQGIGGLFTSVDQAFVSANRELPTSRLNRILASAVAATPPPMVRGRRIRLKFAHQGGRNPPVVVIHGNQVASLPDAYRRYLANVFREAFDLVGTPVRIECREGENPYEGRRPERRRRRGR
ncbi:ribosome-associated GTPase EngA [Sulfurifustis variabilis]|uniref:GTPase Der n=1 Tax=Sulfurifustis variabilis TaxID=1675686 RepID=A0A1B4V3L2_9GAMM|nr:ribosome biogenesis GTPase Der [Sulfurifustis variabilis]BAU48150.1 ribosome-associated GTPase EngA [Sulfurifustis variabilis]